MTGVPTAEPKTTEFPLLLGAFESTSLGNIAPVLQCQYHVERWLPQCAADYGISIPAHMARAVPKRLAEFVAGRALASQLLATYGCNAEVGHSQSDRAPLWPAGYTGSITHSDGIAACTLMPQKDVWGVGIDIEHKMSPKTSEQVGSAIWSDREAELFLQQGWDRTTGLTTVFSAKEALFKALYPRCKKFFGFTAARVFSVGRNQSSGQLRLTLSETLCADYPAGSEFAVHYQVIADRVVTGLKVPPEPPAKLSL